ncbi:MAG TPA: hypothetical protein VKU02_08780 [Gemmataceae bacterium]|nr:hypothetical protein [Gemmataceae bacterium]
MRKLSYPLAWLALSGLASIASARVDADPNKEYAVTPAAGPWMIRVTTYVGPEARHLAHQMVLEIRSRFDLPAYVVNWGDEERRKQQQELEQFRKQFPDYQGPIRHTRIQEQCAVLIGGYKDLDAAHRALKDVKKLPAPSSEKLMAVLAQAGPPKQGEDKSLLEGTFVNPFLDSFVVPNPTVAPEHKADSKNDPFLKKLNAHESYSLLQCKKKWTLIVAAYQGAHTIQPVAAKNEVMTFFNNLWGSTSGEMLEASGQNAHNLADAMHKLGFEAYVLHTRWGSLVTVGGFERADDPHIQEMQRALASRVRLEQTAQMLPQPVPMEVPRP